MNKLEKKIFQTPLLGILMKPKNVFDMFLHLYILSNPFIGNSNETYYCPNCGYKEVFKLSNPFIGNSNET